MKPDARDLRFGPYRTPRYKLRTWVTCQYRGRVKITGTSDGRIPWPMTTLPNGIQVLVLYRDLARAVRHESYPALQHWFGATVDSVWKWRKALHVKDTPGNAALRKLHATPERHAMMGRAAARVARDPERRAKIAAAKRGKKRPPALIEKLRQSNIGRKHTAAARARMSAAQRARGTRPSAAGAAWSDEEIELLRRLSPIQAAAKTGWTLQAVYVQRNRLKLPSGKRRDSKSGQFTGQP